MRDIKTVRGYLNAVKRLEQNGIMGLKGYDNLTHEQQITLGIISAEMSNTLGEFEDLLEDN